jgi:hypothetical protein
VRDRPAFQRLDPHGPAPAICGHAVAPRWRRTSISNQPNGALARPSRRWPTSIRRNKRGKIIVEVYDPAVKAKIYVKPRDHGMRRPRNTRQANALEPAASNAIAARSEVDPVNEETLHSFLDPWSVDEREGRGRWTRDFASRRGDSTLVHYEERVRRFAERYADRTLRSITRTEAREQERGPTVKRSRQRFWAAYTMCRPGETYAARRSLLHGDTYSLRAQMSSLLGRETRPKTTASERSTCPSPRGEAVLRLPRSIHDDRLFHTKRGRQFRNSSWWQARDPVRNEFVRELPANHHLRERVTEDPDANLDFHELRHMGAAYALNELGIEPWVIARQLRHSDNGTLVVQLYGHPTVDTVMDRMRRGVGCQARTGSAQQPPPRRAEAQIRPGAASSRAAQQNTATWNGSLATLPAVLAVATMMAWGLPVRLPAEKKPRGLSPPVPLVEPTNAQPETSRSKSTS